MSESVLVIGASGQVGSELTEVLRSRLGKEKVIASDIKEPNDNTSLKDGPFETLDVLDKDRLEEIIKKYGIKQIYHLAALLSATAEQKPFFAWKLNMDGLLNVLNLGKEGLVNKIFWPSSIAVFGPTTPKENTPQDTIMDPDTIYGISKLAGERWCEYFYKKFNVDVRSVRYPGLISYKTLPGGGTTDYAIDIFHQALKENKYTCFLKSNASLPMLYMPDAIKATIDIMDANPEKIKVRSSYNIAGFSFSPDELAAKIKSHLDNFEIDYAPDFRQKIAEGWPSSINDSKAREDWNWNPDYSFDAMVKDMLENIQVLYETNPS